jgi:hypothetical protein
VTSAGPVEDLHGFTHERLVRVCVALGYREVAMPSEALNGRPTGTTGEAFGDEEVSKVVESRVRDLRLFEGAEECVAQSTMRPGRPLLRRCDVQG